MISLLMHSKGWPYKKVLRFSVLFLYGLILSSPYAFATYEGQVREQVQKLHSERVGKMNSKYFYDMGVLARKADEAQLNGLTSEIVGGYLLKTMNDYVESEVDKINELYFRDPYKASIRLNDLKRYKTYYQPTHEYLSVTGGQAFSGELARLRKLALNKTDFKCSQDSITEMIKAIRQTGLFATNKAEEIKTLRELRQKLDCCIRWKSMIYYYDEKAFESEYESGTTFEEAKLRLTSSPANLSEAQWEGDWLYRFEGREGVARGVSKAVLKYRKGEEFADLKVTSSRVTSQGRINFPISLSGEHRSLFIEDEPLYPDAIFSNQASVPLAGCEPNKMEKP